MDLLLHADRMKITFLMAPPPVEPDGHFQTHYSYASELSRRGHEVTVLHGFPPEQRASVEAVMARGVSERDYPMPVGGWFRFDAGVRLLYTSFQDVTDAPPADALIGQAQTCGADAYPPDRGVNFSICNSYAALCTPDEQHRIWRYAGWKIMNARWLYERALVVGIPAHEIGHVPNGVDTSVFRPGQPIEDRPDRIAIHLSPGVKGAALGVEALLKVRRQWPHVRVIGFGRMARPPWVPDWFQYLTCPTRAELVADVYSASSIFLCPGIQEGFNNPSLEAMACGCAVVGTDMGAMRDYARHQENALLAPVRDSESMAAYVHDLLRDPAHRARLATRGLETARLMTWARSAAQFDAFLATRIEASHRAGTDPRRAALEGTSAPSHLEASLKEVLSERGWSVPDAAIVSA